MNITLIRLKARIYDPCGLEIKDYQNEEESQEYEACRFTLNGKLVISRSAKITPKKVGQFATFWKRQVSGPIEPFHEQDAFDFYVVNAQTKSRFGQFVFPKTILISKGILSTDQNNGKRAFRVYPSWDNVHSKHAMRTQKWQCRYFYEVNDHIDVRQIKGLYTLN